MNDDLEFQIMLVFHEYCLGVMDSDGWQEKWGMANWYLMKTPRQYQPEIDDIERHSSMKDYYHHHPEEFYGLDIQEDEDTIWYQENDYEDGLDDEDLDDLSPI